MYLPKGESTNYAEQWRRKQSECGWVHEGREKNCGVKVFFFRFLSRFLPVFIGFLYMIHGLLVAKISPSKSTLDLMDYRCPTLLCCLIQWSSWTLIQTGLPGGPPIELKRSSHIAVLASCSRDGEKKKRR